MGQENTRRSFGAIRQGRDEILTSLKGLIHARQLDAPLVQDRRLVVQKSQWHIRRVGQIRMIVVAERRKYRHALSKGSEKAAGQVAGRLPALGYVGEVARRQEKVEVEAKEQILGVLTDSIPAAKMKIGHVCDAQGRTIGLPTADRHVEVVNDHR